jgi:hypothetical protein
MQGCRRRAQWRLACMRSRDGWCRETWACAKMWKRQATTMDEALARANAQKVPAYGMVTRISATSGASRAGIRHPSPIE